MGTHATLIKITKSSLTPGITQKLSDDLSLPLEKTQHGLQSILPSLLMAFSVNASQTAQLIKENKSSEEAIPTLFGNELTNFATKLQPFSDMALASIIRMIQLLSPLVLEVLKEKIDNEILNTHDLVIYLNEQTPALAEVVPTDISNHFGYGTSNTRMGHTSRFVEGTKKELTPYPKH